MFTRPTVETRRGRVSIYRRIELPSTVDCVIVPITQRDVMTWLSRDARTREAILSEYTRFMGGPGQYRPPTRAYLAHVAKVLERAFYSGTLVAVLNVDAALPEMGSVTGGDVAAPPTEEPRVLRLRPTRTWVSIELLDDAGDPVGDIAFELELPDGSKRSGRLDERGRARFDGIVPGECKVSFPDIDASEWSPT